MLSLPRSNFNPCSPCGERPDLWILPSLSNYFNPCSPCGERLVVYALFNLRQAFQSMLPVRGATTPQRFKRRTLTYFNPCSPCGERLCLSGSHVSALQFQSMLPVRGATQWLPCRSPPVKISIHAPRAGSDQDRFPRVNADCISIHAPRAGSDRRPCSGKG